MNPENTIPKFDPSDRSDRSDPSVKSVKSVNTLESLVPPLDLCKQIPEGAFTNSVFVWSYSCDKRKTEPFLDERDCIEFCRRDMVNAPPIYPAPTLAEIMGDCPDCFARRYKRANPKWAVIFLRKYGLVETVAFDEGSEEHTSELQSQ